ncbi:glycoside hydrolase family 68 protein [Bacillaceae bacterium Marseille-Q3522]|nr:glycoside hydrolase family 68 protein [Bacillaceae bacterium Marseille-Q3522]
MYNHNKAVARSNGTNKGKFTKSRACRQTSIVPDLTPQESPIPGGPSNRNFPSAVGSGNQVSVMRTFSEKNVEKYCCYQPCKDVDRCLDKHRDAVPSQWTREDAEQIRITPENAAPVIQTPFPRISPNVWIWDTWPLLEKDGSIALLPGGWRVIFCLTAPRTVLPGKRHDVAKIGYFYSKNGLDWIEGGPVFEEGTSFGSREWAGSAFVEDGVVRFFYTAVGRAGEPVITFEQRLAVAFAEVRSDDDGVRFINFSPHQIILEPDGVLYQTLEQSMGGGIIYAFRDPWWFKDPATGCEYLLFEGNVAGTAEDVNCGPGVPLEARAFSGNIGIALLASNDYSEWILLPALLEARCTNQQTERPHIIVKGGRYYLFTDSHEFTFAPGLEPGPGPDGLYGFVASSLRGNYVPLNDGGLVVANPPEEPFQAYSWLVLPDFTVTSFIDNFNLQGIPIEEVGLLPAEFQFEHFGGTLAPTLQLEITGPTTTNIVRELEFGLITVSEFEAPKCIKQRDELQNGFCDNRPKIICKKCGKCNCWHDEDHGEKFGHCKKCAKWGDNQKHDHCEKMRKKRPQLEIRTL